MYPPKQECLTPLTKGFGIEPWVNTFNWKYLSVYSLLFFFLVFGVKLPFVKQCSIEEPSRIFNAPCNAQCIEKFTKRT